MNLRRPAAALLLLAALAPSAAFAQGSDADKGTARELTIQGYNALTAKDWATAADRFSRADKLYHAPTITVGLARAHAALGKLVAAHEEYSRVTHEPVPPNASAAFTSAIEDAGRELAALTPRVPGVVINLKGPEGARVTLDDAEVPSAALGVKRPADPGKHVVRAVAVGCTPTEATVTLVEGGTETVTLELKPGPGGPVALPLGAQPLPPGAAVQPPPDEPPPSSTRKTVGFVGIGLGGVGIIVGAITGGLALSKHSSLESVCTDGHCPKNTQTTNQPLIDSYDTMGTISTAGFIGGGVLAVAGIILVATAPRSVQRTAGAILGTTPSRTATVSPFVGAGSAGVLGRF
jgi:hypothetical protein